MKIQSIYSKAAVAIHRFRISQVRRRDQAIVSRLPDYLLKDIGWPAHTNELCKDCA